MPNYTTNYNLKKPLQTENYNVDDFNGNADIIDTALKNIDDTKVDVEVGKGLSDENYTLLEKNKLAGIEENATADMTALEIKTEYESNADTNAYTDAEKAKVANLPDDTIAQLAEIETDIAPVKDGTTVYAPVWINGKYVEINGQIKDYAGWKWSGYLEIPSGITELMFTTNYNLDNSYNCFYDKNYAPISYNTFPLKINHNVTKQVIKVHPQAKYFALSVVSTYNITAEYTSYGIASTAKNNIDKLDVFLGKNKKKTFRSISRMGYDFSNIATPPPESINSFKLAVKYGFDTLRCNLQFTSDNIPVAFHDVQITSTNARLKNGKPIPASVNVSSLTYAQINDTYDFGYPKNQPGYGMTKIEDVLVFCKLVGVDLYIEMKMNPTNAQSDILLFLIKKYGMEKYVTIIGTYSASIASLKYMRDNSKIKRIGVIFDYIDSSIISLVSGINNGIVEVFIYGWNTMDITDWVDDMIVANIGWEAGTIDTEQGIIDYMQGANLYCTGIESNKFVASKVLYDKAVSV